MTLVADERATARTSARPPGRNKASATEPSDVARHKGIARPEIPDELTAVPALNEHFSAIPKGAVVPDMVPGEAITYSSVIARGETRAEAGPPQPRISASLHDITALCKANLLDGDRLGVAVDAVTEEINRRTRGARIYANPSGDVHKFGRYVPVEKPVIAMLRRSAGKHDVVVPEPVDRESERGLAPPDVAIAEIAAHGVDAQKLANAIVCYEGQWHGSLVMMVASKLARSRPGVNAQGLLSWGWVGLHSSLRAFDPSRGWKFSTYACQKIDFAIRGGLRDTQSRPKKLITIYNRVSAVRGMISSNTGREASIADALAVIDDDSLPDADTLEAMFTRMQPDLSLDSAPPDRTGSDAGASIGESLSHAGPEGADPWRIHIDSALGGLRHLPDTERIVVEMAVLDRIPMAEISKATGISVNRVKTAKTAGLAKLREFMQSEGLSHPDDIASTGASLRH